MARLKGDREKVLFTQLGTAERRLYALRQQYAEEGKKDMRSLRQIQLAKQEVERIANTIEIERIFR